MGSLLRRLDALEDKFVNEMRARDDAASNAIAVLAKRVHAIAAESGERPRSTMAPIGQTLVGRWTYDHLWNHRAMLSIRLSTIMDWELSQHGHTAGEHAAEDAEGLLEELETRLRGVQHLIGSPRVFSFWDGTLSEQAAHNEACV